VSFVTEELSDTIEEECKDVSHHSLIDDKDENDKSRKGEGARPITEREKEVMLQAARDKNNKKLVVILRILYQTGLRAKELAELELEDIDLEEMEIEVETAKRDGHTRTLSINPSLREDLQTYINKHRMKFTQAPSSEYLLPTHKSKNMYPRNLTREVRNLAKDVGIQNENPDEQFIAQNGATRNEITVHSFRKRFGLNRLNDPDGNVRKAQLLLGHKDMTTTQHYLELDDEDLDYEP
jgi:integrase